MMCLLAIVLGLITEIEKCELIGALAEKKTILTPHDTISILELCDLMVSEGEWSYEE